MLHHLYGGPPTSPGRPALALALRFCVDGEKGLAQKFKRIPADHLSRAGVRCPCGSVTPLAADLRPCEGFCGRWFAEDASGAWSVQT